MAAVYQPDKLQAINHPANYLLALEHTFRRIVFDETEVLYQPLSLSQSAVQRAAICGGSTSNFVGLNDNTADIEVGTTYGFVDNLELDARPSTLSKQAWSIGASVSIKARPPTIISTSASEADMITRQPCPDFLYSSVVLSSFASQLLDALFPGRVESDPHSHADRRRSSGITTAWPTKPRTERPCSICISFTGSALGSGSFNTLPVPATLAQSILHRRSARIRSLYNPRLSKHRPENLSCLGTGYVPGRDGLSRRVRYLPRTRRRTMK